MKFWVSLLENIKNLQIRKDISCKQAYKKVIYVNMHTIPSKKKKMDDAFSIYHGLMIYKVSISKNQF